jgi:hypothetical protein
MVSRAQCRSLVDCCSRPASSCASPAIHDFKHPDIAEAVAPGVAPAAAGGEESLTESMFPEGQKRSHIILQTRFCGPIRLALTKID